VIHFKRCAVGKNVLGPGTAPCRNGNDCWCLVFDNKKWQKFFQNMSNLYHFYTELYTSCWGVWTAALSVQHYVILPGWDSNPFTGASPDLPTNGNTYMHPYTITYSKEWGVNNAALHAYILSLVALRPNTSAHLGSTIFESQLRHWLACMKVLSFFSAPKRQIPNKFSYCNQSGPVLSDLCPGCFDHLSAPLPSILLGSGAISDALP
jgi:hypothetical protein